MSGAIGLKSHQETAEQSGFCACRRFRESGLCPNRSAGMKLGWGRPPPTGGARAESGLDHPDLRAQASGAELPLSVVVPSKADHPSED